MDNNHNVTELHKPDNPLNELLKQGAQQLLAQAIKAEVQALLEQFASLQADGKQAVVRNGHLPERTLQTGLGDITVKVPKVRDRTRSGIKFNMIMKKLALAASLQAPASFSWPMVRVTQRSSYKVPCAAKPIKILPPASSTIVAAQHLATKKCIVLNV